MVTTVSEIELLNIKMDQNRFLYELHWIPIFQGDDSGVTIHCDQAISIVVQAGSGSSAASEFTGEGHSGSLGAGKFPKVGDPQNHGLHH